MSYLDLLKPVSQTEFAPTTGKVSLTPKQRFLFNIEQQLKLFKGGQSKLQRTFWIKKGSDGREYVEFSFKVANKKVLLRPDSKELNMVVPKDDFEAVALGIVEAVGEGAFDKQL